MSKFKTYDLALAAYLLTCGQKMHPPEKEPDRNRFNFVFDNTEELGELHGLFVRRQATVEPIDYFNAIRGLKSQMYSEIKN